MRSVAVVLALAALGCGSAKALRSPNPAPAPERPYQNKLRWKTASEVDNFGYDVYRAETEAGPFERVTERPVPGAGTSDLPREYEWVDTRIDPRRTYYYYVESISMGGARERFTPVIRAKPKLEHGSPQPTDATIGGPGSSLGDPMEDEKRER